MERGGREQAEAWVGARGKRGKAAGKAEIPGLKPGAKGLTATKSAAADWA